MPFVTGMNATIMWIALTVGILLFIIGYFAGGRLTFGRIWLCTAVITLISVLALPAPMALYHVVKQQFEVDTYVEKQQVALPKQKTMAGPEPAAANEEKQNASEPAKETPPVQPPIGFQVLTLVMHIVWTGFLVSMGIFFYETLIVTAQEAEKR
jgi:hypothetical protein